MSRKDEELRLSQAMKQNPEHETVIKEANSKEIHGIQLILGLASQIQEYEKHLEERLRSVPGLWRQYRAGASMVNKAVSGVYKTLPANTIRNMNMLLEHGEVVVRFTPATRNEELQLVRKEPLQMLINKVVAQECAMCLLDARGQKRCKLRRALMDIAVPRVISERRCPYMDVVANGELGRYI